MRMMVRALTVSVLALPRAALIRDVGRGRTSDELVSLETAQSTRGYMRWTGADNLDYAATIRTNSMIAALGTFTS